MATKTAKKTDKKSTAAIIKTKAANINSIALKTTNEIVEETIATSEQWQNLMEKTFRKGTILFGKQQDMMLSGLEILKDQYTYGSKRLRKLLTFKPIDSKTPSKGVPSGKKPATKKPTATAKTEKSIDQVMKAATTAEKAVKKAVQPTIAKKAVSAKAPSKRVPSGKKPAVATKTKAIPSTAAKQKNLTLIEGIGPKIQELLNGAGIATLDKLSAAAPADLKKILTDAGTRFQMHDPSTWAAQAKLAAAGKMDELKVLQAELKGGK